MNEIKINNITLRYSKDSMYIFIEEYRTEIAIDREDISIIITALDEIRKRLNGKEY